MLDAFVEAADPGGLRVLAALLDGVEEDIAELLDVVLHERIAGRPTEAVDQGLGVHELLAGLQELQLGEQVLQLQRNAVLLLDLDLLIVVPAAAWT